MTLTNKIQIDIISDVVCPWCVVGYKRLTQAMKELGVEDRFEIQWHPFELNPNMPAEGEDIIEHMGRKYSMSIQQAKAAQEGSKKTFEEVGFPFDFYEGKRIVNTRDAHILLDYAKEEGKQTELKLALFKANFGERKNVSDREELKLIVKSIGLDEDIAIARLDNPNFIKILQEKEDYWKSKGVSSVPTMVFNGENAMNGAYPVETYKQVLTELLENK